MEFLFWMAVLIIFYTYVGYPLYLLAYACLMRHRDIESSAPDKTTGPIAIDIILPVHNGERYIERRLKNILALDYPHNLINLIVVLDGCTDATGDIIENFFATTGAGIPHIVLHIDRNIGKSSALNLAMKHAKHPVIVFMDVRQIWKPDALRWLTDALNDECIGAVSGQLIIHDSSGTDVSGIYWKYEKMLRQIESRAGSVIGVSGSIYAARRELIPDLPEGLILDDLYIPMHICRYGYMVKYEPRAIAYDNHPDRLSGEINRKIRTLAGNLQLISVAPWIISPAMGEIFWRLVSHKLLRFLVPYSALILLATTAFLRDTPYRLLFWSQIIGYLYTMLILVYERLMTQRKSILFQNRLGRICVNFLVLNYCAMLAPFYYFSGQYTRLWRTG